MKSNSVLVVTFDAANWLHIMRTDTKRYKYIYICGSLSYLSLQCYFCRENIDSQLWSLWLVGHAHVLLYSGPRLNLKTVFPGMGIFSIKVGRSSNCLMFIMGIYWYDNLFILRQAPEWLHMSQIYVGIYFINDVDCLRPNRSRRDTLKYDTYIAGLWTVNHFCKRILCIDSRHYHTDSEIRSQTVSRLHL